MTKDYHNFQRSEISNFLRGFLKENDIPTLDVIILFIQSHNILMEIINKNIGTDGLIDNIVSLHEDQKNYLAFAAHLCMEVSEFSKNIGKK
jgi:hypothetical protein